jgi:serine/threonine protein kinase
MLKYPGSWKFGNCGFTIPNESLEEFKNIILTIANGSIHIIQDFKNAFGVNYLSTSLSWAQTDLENALEEKSSNAALFLDCFWNGIQTAKNKDLVVPEPEHINSLLTKYKVPFRIDPPNLIKLDVDAEIADNVDEDVFTEKKVSNINYIIQEKLGAGGYGIVYKAIRKTSISNFEYAIKILDPTPFVDDKEKALQRFKREIEILKSLQHRSIIQYFDAGFSTDGKPFIVMPFIKGTDLLTDCRSNGPDFTLHCFIEILNALSYAHDLDVIHRDLKPSNIIVRESDGQPIILDFGSAYTLSQMDSKTLTTQAVGTIGYIPSEILIDPKIRSPLQDIYACGIMLYETFFGTRPDPANYRSLNEINNKFGKFDTIIKKTIAGEKERMSSAKEFRFELEKI